jgi:hypothetical protein
MPAAADNHEAHDYAERIRERLPRRLQKLREAARLSMYALWRKCGVGIIAGLMAVWSCESTAPAKTQIPMNAIMKTSHRLTFATSLILLASTAQAQENNQAPTTKVALAQSWHSHRVQRTNLHRLALPHVTPVI